MSDPRDELLDFIQLELHRMRGIVDAVSQKVATERHAAISEYQWCFAAGQCVAIAEQLLREIEQLKRVRSNKTASG